jgi:Flp pilus assembly protein TadD
LKTQYLIGSNRKSVKIIFGAISIIILLFSGVANLHLNNTVSAQPMASFGTSTIGTTIFKVTIEEAVKWLIRSLQNEPENTGPDLSSIDKEIHYKVNIFVDNGFNLLRNFNYEMLPQAINNFDQALELDPNNQYAMTGKGTALAMNGFFNQALTFADRALQINPDNEAALRIAFVSSMSLGIFDQALPIGDRLLTYYPNDYNILSMHLQASFQLGYYNISIYDINRMLNMNPHDPFPFSYLAMINVNQGDCMRAMNNINQIMPYSVGNPFYSYVIQDVLMKCSPPGEDDDDK